MSTCVLRKPIYIKCKSKRGKQGPTGPSGLPGQKGPTGPTGPVGPTGPTGPIECPCPVLWNKTLFVDEQFGNDATGQREDETKPFKTLNGAENSALSGDLIYVKPGSYIATSPLGVTPNLNWFFEKGTFITNNGVDPLWNTNPTIKTLNVRGYGIFTATNSFVLDVFNLDSLIFEADEITSDLDNGSAHIVSLTNDPSKYIIRAKLMSNMVFTDISSATTIIIEGIELITSNTAFDISDVDGQIFLQIENVITDNSFIIYRSPVPHFGTIWVNTANIKATTFIDNITDGSITFHLNIKSLNILSNINPNYIIQTNSGLIDGYIGCINTSLKFTDTGFLILDGVVTLIIDYIKSTGNNILLQLVSGNFNLTFNSIETGTTISGDSFGSFTIIDGLLQLKGKSITIIGGSITSNTFAVKSTGSVVADIIEIKNITLFPINAVISYHSDSDSHFNIQKMTGHKYGIFSNSNVNGTLNIMGDTVNLNERLIFIDNNGPNINVNINNIQTELQTAFIRSYNKRIFIRTNEALSTSDANVEMTSATSGTITLDGIFKTLSTKPNIIIDAAVPIIRLIGTTFITSSTTWIDSLIFTIDIHNYGMITSNVPTLSTNVVNFIIPDPPAPPVAPYFNVSTSVI